MKDAPTIAVSLRVSGILVAAIVLVMVLALIAVSLTGAHGWVRNALFILVLVLGSTAVGRARPRITSLVWRSDGGADIRLRDTALEDGREVQGAIQTARVMGPLIVLTIRWPPRERAHLWLLPDNLDADTRRRLRARLGAGLPLSGNADTG